MGSTALGEAEEKLRPDADFHHKQGYIDAVGENPRSEMYSDQAMFKSKLLPPIYERWWRPLVASLLFGRGFREEEERKIALDMLSVSPGDSVLDVGCGTGNYARHIAEAAGDGLVVGIDASQAMIASAVRRGGGGNLAYMVGDACALPFDDGEFGRVCNICSLHMIVNGWREAVTEMVRVLAPGGRLAIVVTYEEVAKAPFTKGKVKVFGRDELTGVLEEEGLVEIEQRVVGRSQFVVGCKPDRG
jgi:SAM-dependent methyltransferase